MFGSISLLLNFFSYYFFNFCIDDWPLFVDWKLIHFDLIEDYLFSCRKNNWRQSWRRRRRWWQFRLSNETRRRPAIWLQLPNRFFVKWFSHKINKTKLNRTNENRKESKRKKASTKRIQRHFDYLSSSAMKIVFCRFVSLPFHSVYMCVFAPIVQSAVTHTKLISNVQIKSTKVRAKHEKRVKKFNSLIWSICTNVNEKRKTGLDNHARESFCFDGISFPILLPFRLMPKWKSKNDKMKMSMVEVDSKCAHWQWTREKTKRKFSFTMRYWMEIKSKESEQRGRRAKKMERKIAEKII